MSYISDTDEVKRTEHKLQRAAAVHLGVSFFLILADRIYAQFSHGVSSMFMSGAFLCPFIGGVLFYLTLLLIVPRVSAMPKYRLMANLQNSGVALLAVGCFVKGVFQIAGTDSSLMVVYWTCGAAFLLAALVTLVRMITKR